MPSETIQWFPGHMAKTRRMMRECLPAVDLVIEIRDARIPYSSRNPELTRLIGAKPLLSVFNKASLADPAASAAWKRAAAEAGEGSIFTDCLSGYGLNGLKDAITEAMAFKTERYEEKGMAGRRLKAMVVGIPNVGKSSFINRITGTRKAKVEDRPGVTVDKQWVQSPIGLDLLDMPGVLWPKFEDQIVGENLAMTGAIKDAVLDIEDIAARLCGRLRTLYPAEFAARYKLTPDDFAGKENYEIFEMIGRKRGFLVSGGDVSGERTAVMLLDEFRAAKIGRFTLERPGKK